ncbi:caspase family protein [Glycomyces sp. NPDC048151]|uniref:caspase family protein n=1 Tax=Glycomyces sp. NPDC048151 TaxID=3364002 RepID=UPI0037130310
MPDRRYRALLIGNAVFRRDPQGLPKLQGPRADVDALCEALADPQSGMFATEDIETHIDRSHSNLREELYRFYIEEATRDDVLLLYYSGHGKLDLQGRLHLCTSDTLVSRLRVTSLQYKEHIDALIQESPAAATVTILDCCHSGAFRGGELKVKATGNGRCVITSASATELALDALGPGGTSPFTNVLVTGLRFAPTESQLSAQDLYDYLETELRPAGTSRPQFYFDGTGSIVLARRSVPASEPSIPPTAESGHFIQHVMTGTDLGEFNIPGPTADRDSPSSSLGLHLPEPRTHLWRLLNEAVASALSEDDENDKDPSERLREVFEAAAQLDDRWPKAVLKRLPQSREQFIVVEALCAGLARIDARAAIEFAQRFTFGSAERTGAQLAIAAALPDSELVLAQQILQEAIASCKDGYGDRETQLLVRLFEIQCSAEIPEPPADIAPLARVARALNQIAPDIWGDLIEDLESLLWNQPDQAVWTPVQAEAALRMARFAPSTAQRFFSLDGHMLHESDFERLPIEDITCGGSAMLAIDPPIGHRLLEIAERRCRSHADWVKLFNALLDALQTSPGPSPAQAEHLITMVERAVDHVAEEERWRLSHAADALVATAPVAASRLLRIDSDEDRMRRGLIRVAKQAAAVDAVTARPIAYAAERLVLSILDEVAEANELIYLAEAFAAIDPDHAVRLIRSMPENGLSQSLAISKVAAVFAATSPDRIARLVRDLATGEKAERVATDVYDGVAEVDPERALELVASLPESPYKSSVIATAAEAIAAFAPHRAAEVAATIDDEYRRGHTLLSIVQTIVKDDPDWAALIALTIPDTAECAYARVSALCMAGLALPAQAEELLTRAEITAGQMDNDYLKGSLLCDIANAHIEIGSVPLRASRLLSQAELCASASAEDDADRRTALLAEVMVGWASIAPRKAERIAEGLPDDWKDRDTHFERAATALAADDPRRAEQFIAMIGGQDELLRAQSALVEEFCRSAPGRAEQLALTMKSGSERTQALLTVAEAEQRRRSW